MGRFCCNKDQRNFALFCMRLSAIKARRKGLKAAFWAFTCLIINHLARFLFKKKAFGGFGAVFLLLVFVVLIVYKKTSRPAPVFEQ